VPSLLPVALLDVFAAFDAPHRGTTAIDFDCREAKPGSSALRNHGTKFRVAPKDVCRLYMKKERFS
jgi:hypothetical protein